MPGVLSGFLLAFTMSLDDFIITHFTKGPSGNYTPVHPDLQRGKARHTAVHVRTVIHLYFLTVLILLIFVNFRSIKKPENGITEFRH